MKIAFSKFRKPLILLSGTIVIIVVAVILLISPIAKYLIEKYDFKYTGRQIKTGLVYVNPFTGFLHIRNLKIYESNDSISKNQGDSVFLSADGLSASISLRKLLSKNIVITELTLTKPRGIIQQDGKIFNFSDLITRYTPKHKSTKPSGIRFSLLNIKIIHGEFHYREKVIPINYYIRDVNIVSTGIFWDSDTIRASFAFLSGTGSGTAKGNFAMDFRTLNYRFTALIKQFDLQFLEQYLKDLANYGHFSANLDADLTASGSFLEGENINASGLIEMTKFHFGKTPANDYASFDKLLLKIDQLNPKKHLYLFDSLLLTHPYFKYERYDNLDNLQTMFGEDGANISASKADPAHFNLILQIADYIKILAKNFFKSDYKINKLAIYDGDFKFNDYSLSEKFSIDAKPVFIYADSINKHQKRVNISLKSGVQPYGNILVNLSINPNDSGDFDMHYSFEHFPAAIINPYLITYTSFPFDRGTLELKGTWHVLNGNIKSENHLLLIDPRITKRIRKKDAKYIPLPLIMAFIRERGNVIDYEIPITGNLKDPKFNIRDVLLDLLGNIFVKPVTTPYRLQIKTIENEIEKSLTLKWPMRQSSLLPSQEKFIKRMAEFLDDHPEASLSIYPVHYEEKEKEYISLFEARKSYLFSNRKMKETSLNSKDSLTIEKMSVKDSMFIKYLDKHKGNSGLFTVQEKCVNVNGTAGINAKFASLNKERMDVFLGIFRKKGVEKRIKFLPAENTIPYNGYSFYKIVYKGELPKSLVKAYEQMNEYNKLAPRKWFRKEREKNSRQP